MICGAGSFPHEHDDEPPSTPRKGKQNPYSTRGLDKFSTVLAELGAKKERIMARTRDSQGVALVQFVYHNSKDWVPIVVRPKPDKKQPPPPPLTEPSSTQTQTTVVANKQDQSKDIVVAAAAAATTTEKAAATERGKMRTSCRRSLYSWRPSYYWPSVLVLILVCLVMFGRVFAICCTSIWWYMLPTLKELYSNAGAGDEDAKKKKKNMRKKKEKEYGRKLSDKRLTTPSSQAKKA